MKLGPMTSHTTSSGVSRLEVITIGARRRWTDYEKFRIVEESYAGHRMVSSTARRHGLCTGQLFTWRRLAREGQLGVRPAPSFVPAVIVADAATLADAAAVRVAEVTPESPQRAAGGIEIVLGAARIFVDTGVDEAALSRVFGALGWR